jgi:5,10-methylenetetrahydromethanopterin reductase
VHLTDRDRAALGAEPSLLQAFTWTGSPEEVRAKAEAAEAGGATEVIYAPMGPDPERELRAFLAAVRGS